MGKRAEKIGIVLFLALLFVITLNVSPVILAAQNETSASRFTDVAANDQELSYVNYLSNKGIITGHPDGTFKPLEALTRAQAAVVMVKAGQLQLDPQAPSPFKDLNAEHWAKPYVAAAVKAGYISGFPDETFRPEQNLTRAEAITLILRLSKQALSAPLPALSDMDAQHWAARAVGTGLASGMVGLSADGKQFLPDEAFSRINMVHALGILFSKDPELYASSLPGKIKIIQGKVKIIKSGSQQEELLQGERIVHPGDQIISEKGGSAELSYADGSSLLIKEETRLSIKEAQGRKYIKTNGQEGIAVEWLNIDLKQGTVLAALATKHENTEDADTLKTGETKTSSLYHSNLIASLDGRRFVAAAAKTAANTTPWYQASKDKKVKVKVDMPWGVAAIRGTFALINVAPNGQANVSCLTGSAEVTNGGLTVPLGQNQSTGISEPGAPPPPPAPMPPAALQQFAQEQNWIQQTAQNMDRNREQAPPPPPPALNLQVPTPAPPANPGSGSALQAVNQAMQNSGITGPGSQGDESPTNSSSDNDSNSTVVAVTVGSISPQSVKVDKSISVTITSTPADAVIHAESSNNGVASVTVSGQQLTISGLSKGSVTITVTASKSGYSSANTSFSVSVEASQNIGYIEPGALIGSWNLQDAVLLNDNDNVLTQELNLTLADGFNFDSYSVHCLKPEYGETQISDELAIGQPFRNLTSILAQTENIFIEFPQSNGVTVWAVLGVGGKLTNAATQKISGTISMPPDQLAPQEGIKVAVNIQGESKYGYFHSYCKAFISEGQTSAPFELVVPINTEGYDLRYKLYNLNTTTVAQNGCYGEKIQVVAGDVEELSFQMSPGVLVNGILTMGEALSEEVELSIFASNEEEQYYSWLSIQPGQIQIPFTIVLPASESGYYFGYGCWNEESCPAGYIREAYYGENGMTAFRNEASWIPVLEAMQDLQLSMLHGTQISGTIKLPYGIVAPAGGIDLHIDSNLAWSNLFMEEGSSEVSYTIYAPSVSGYCSISVYSSNYSNQLQANKSFEFSETGNILDITLQDDGSLGLYQAEDVPNNSLMIGSHAVLLDSNSNEDNFLNCDYDVRQLYYKSPTGVWFDLTQAPDSGYLELEQNALSDLSSIWVLDFMKSDDRLIQIDTAYTRNNTIAMTLSHKIVSAEMNESVIGIPIIEVLTDTNQETTEMYNIGLKLGEVLYPLTITGVDLHPQYSEQGWKLIVTVDGECIDGQEYTLFLYQGILDDNTQLISATPISFQMLP